MLEHQCGPGRWPRPVGVLSSLKLVSISREMMKSSGRSRWCSRTTRTGRWRSGQMFLQLPSDLSPDMCLSLSLTEQMLCLKMLIFREGGTFEKVLVCDGEVLQHRGARGEAFPLYWLKNALLHRSTVWIWFSATFPVPQKEKLEQGKREDHVHMEHHQPMTELRSKQRFGFKLY